MLYPDFKDINFIEHFIENWRVKFSSNNVSTISGEYKSKHKSSGLIFDNIRKYQFGDDKRTIDWRSTARTGKLHVKEFIEERNTELLLVLNNSSEMYFASKGKFKSYIALEIFAFLAFIANQNKDYLSSYIFNSDSEKIYYEKTNKKGNILQLISSISQNTFNKEKNLDNLNIFKTLKLAGVTNQNIFFIVPLIYNFNYEFENYIKALNIKNNLSFIFLWDDIESNLPLINNVEIENNLKETFIIDNNKSTSKNYHNFFLSKKQRLNQFCQNHNIDCFFINTNDDLVNIMVKIFS